MSGSKRTISCLAALTLALSVGMVQAAVVVVNPANMDGWTFYTTDASGVINTPNTATAAMVNGPATPPLPTGSAHFVVPNGAQSAQIRNSSWSATRLDSLTALGYATYATAWNGQQLPWLRLYVDINNDGFYDDRWNFEPTYSRAGAGNGNPTPQPDPALNVWQIWNALGGMWYSDLHGGPGSNAITFAALLAFEPGATLVQDDGQNIGGIRLASGFASNSFDTNVDAFTIGNAARGTTTYNFELNAAAAAVPEPGSLALLAIALGAFAVGRRRKTA